MSKALWIAGTPFRLLVAPGVLVFGLLRYWMKFLIVGLVLVGAVAYVAQAFRDQQRAQTSFSAKERDGVVYVAPALELLAAIADARTQAVRVATGDEAAAAAYDTAMAAANAAAAKIETAEATYGEGLGTGEAWGTVQRDLAAAAPEGDGDAVLGAWDGRVANAIALVTQVANGSNLILDPDLDSYYEMDALVVRVPTLLDTAARIAALDALLAVDGEEEAVQRRIDLAVARGVLESNHAAIVTGLETTYDTTKDAAVKGELEGPSAAVAEAVAATSAGIGATVAGGAPGVADDAAAAAHGAVLALAGPLGVSLDRLLETRVGKLEAHQQRVERIAIIAVAIALYLFLCFYVGVARGARAIGGALNRAATGDLSRGANVRGHDELARMSRALDRTLEGMRTAVRAMATNARTLHDASRELETASDRSGRAMGEITEAIGDIARGAERQATNIHAAREAAERTHAEAADGAEAAARASVDARDGADAAREAVEVMRAVREAAERIDGVTAELGQRSAAIGGIVLTIGRIAEQTNLLALNAAIEAARAGESGRGFAVVADEVRSLAEESRGAAAEIASLIAEIERGIAVAMEAAMQSGERVATGVDTVERATSVFVRITEESAEVASVLERIAGRTSDLSGALTEVTEVAETTSAASQEVSATSDGANEDVAHVADSARSLASAAEELDGLAGRFTLDAESR